MCIRDRAWGIEEVNYSFDGHQIERKRGVRVLTSEELALKDVSLTYVSRLMGREMCIRDRSKALERTLAKELGKITP